MAKFLYQFETEDGEYDLSESFLDAIRADLDGRDWSVICRKCTDYAPCRRCMARKQQIENEHDMAAGRNRGRNRGGNSSRLMAVADDLAMAHGFR